MKTACFRLLLGLLALAAGARAADLPALWAERVKSTVAVEYIVENESDRHPTLAYGVVIDGRGTIILPAAAIDQHLATSQLKDFRVYLPGDPAPYAGTYLGQDVYTGWHFVRVEEKVRSRLTPITAFARPAGPAPALAEELWGIGLRPKEEDFMPYLLQSHLALIQSLPQQTGVTQQEVAGPGLPVFNRDGVFVGLALSSFGQTFMQFSEGNRGGEAVILVDLEESSAFQLAGEILPNLGRVPQNVDGRPLAWLGAYGLEPMDREVANFLKLSAQSGAVVSEVLENSPAEKAGMKPHDIIVAIDGRPVPRFRPDRVVTDYVEREIERRRPGDVMALTVLRGSDRIELKAALGDEPKLVREADRTYFDRLGFTAREFVYGDAVARRIKVGEGGGAIVRYVKPNGPAALSNLQNDDWIQEVDGAPVRTYAEAVARLGAIEKDPLRSEFVLLVRRGSDTTILRVKLR
ncbi:MAG TPA: PDZ domain-containing protein [Opitutaceae bacterium]|jgi:serine protease Do|nr:PDZ domain-containing protein [Opitutaceae bacterium]